MSDEIKELRTTIAVLAARLIEYAGDDVELMPPLEGDEGREVFVHAKNCGGSCDYGCGAVAIMYAKEGAAVIVESVEVGAIRVRGLSGDA
jgi:hypothetical protein